MYFLLRTILQRRSAVGWIWVFSLIAHTADRVVAAEAVPQFSQRNWTRADGLPNNQITNLCEDRSGYLWIATSTGLARFDGSRFLNYDFAPGGKLTASGFASIATDPANDGLWAAPHFGGLVRFRQGRFEEQSLPGGYARQRVARIFVAADGALWLGFEGGEIMRLHDGRHEVFGVRDGLGSRRAAQFAGDDRGRVWMANGPHLAWYESGALHPFNLEGLDEDLRIGWARKDGPWVLSRGWLRKVTEGRLAVKIQVNSNFNAQSVQTLLEDSQGAIWIGTRSRGVRRVTLNDETSDLAIGAPEDVAVLFEDRAGNIWAGSNGGGLARIRAGVVHLFDKSQGLLESHTLSVCEDNAGTIWIANRDGGVAFVNDQGRIHTLTPPKVRDTFSARSVIPIGAGGVWVTTSYGLFRATQQGLVEANAPDSPPPPPDHGQMRVTHLTRNGDLWIALAPGQLGRLREGIWRVFSATDGLGPTIAVQALAEDAQGQIWVGGDKTRLYCFDGVRFAQMPLEAPIEAGALQAIHFDDTGACWIGTAGAGLLRLGSPAGRNLDDQHGLPTRSITQVIGDNQGSLWFGSPEGIFHVRREELEQFFAKQISRVDAVLVGTDEGLGETTCANAHQPSVWKSRAGLLWFATRQGVVAIDPRREKVADTPLVVNIDAVRAGDLSWRATTPVRLPALTRTLELDYSVLCLSTPERVRARVRLKGYDDDWTTTDARGLARYARLTPGEYQFLVEARLAGVPGTAALASVSIVVQAAWWQTMWFRAGLLLLLLMVGALVIRTRTHRRLRARLARLEHDSALEQERARIARNIHDDLGSGLTRISLLTQSDAPGDGRAQLDKIYNAVSGLTQSMDEIVWAVNPKNDDLEAFANYLAEFAQGFLTDAGIRCRMLLPDLLPARALTSQCRHHLFLSCKEALHNIAKHAQATEVSVQLSIRDERLVIVITDNGRGFVTARPGTGNGLANMRTRLEALGGVCEISSSATGTSVTFTAPLRPSDVLS